MTQASVAEILELPVQERIWFVELIWESIAADPEAVEVTLQLKAELEADLGAGCSREQVKLHLRHGRWGSA